jgi:phosphoglycolate phosphatase
VRGGLVVFDLDGTLVDSRADIGKGLNAALQRVHPGTPPLTAEQVRSMIGEGALLLVTKALRATGCDGPPQDVLPVFLECYREHLLDETRLYPGVRETLEALDGRPLAVLTNKPGDLSRAIVDGLGIARFFARVVGGGDGPAKKPDPEGLRRLVEEAGGGASRATMVGDSAIDVATGRAAAVRTVGVTYGFDPEGVRAARPDVLIDRLPALIEHV